MLEFRKLPESLSLTSPTAMIATWFGSGLIKPASGTWGSLASLPFIMVICLCFKSPVLLSAFIAITFIAGLWASKHYSIESNSHDASEIVIDETCGLSISCLPFFMYNFSEYWHKTLFFLAAFIIFRFFDIIKPWPIKWVDQHVEGAFGIMIDDVIAGLFTILTICLIGYFIYA
jgi:phosphatidylglycerophosphatase A